MQLIRSVLIRFLVVIHPFLFASTEVFASDTEFFIQQLRNYPPVTLGELPFGVEVEATYPAPDLRETQVRNAAIQVQASLAEMGLIDRPLPEIPPLGKGRGQIRFDLNDKLHDGAWGIRSEAVLTYNFLRGAVEIVTPIFPDEERLVYLFRVLRKLRRSGLRAAPWRGGVHVHVGLPEPKSRHALLVAALYLKVIEQVESEWMFELSTSYFRQIMKVADLQMRNKPFPLGERAPVFSVLRYYLENHPGGISDFLKLDYQLPASNARPIPIVRLDKLEALGTLETTVWNSTLDERKIRNAVRFARAVVQKLLAHDEALLNRLLDGRRIGLGELYRLLQLDRPPAPLRRACWALIVRHAEDEGFLNQRFQARNSASPAN